MSEVHIHVGYRLIFECVQPTPMLLMLNVHYTRASDIIVPDHMTSNPAVPVRSYRDAYGNWCSRIVAPPGRIEIASSAVVRDSGIPDPIRPDATQHDVHVLPDDVLLFLLGSRYCDTDRLSDIAWSLFGHTPPGWARVQAIADFVHNHIRFDYNMARSTRTAFEAYEERVGVCRDFTHLAIAFCRCMNIPARYCTGYVSDIGMPPPYPPMDFAAWMEVYLDDDWHVFDPRNHVPRIGRILMARGRDAVDVAISTSFGPSLLTSFSVWTNEVGPS